MVQTSNSMRRVETSERQARLARRHRLAPGHSAENVDEAARSLICLHGTDPGTIYMSARSRVEGMTVEDLDRALYTERSLVKHMAMRRTLFVFPRETLAPVQAGASARVAARERKRLITDVEKAGLHPDGEKWLNAAEAQALEVLADGREETMKEIREQAPLMQGSIEYGAGKSWGGKVPVGPRVLTTLSASGQIVRSTNTGPWWTSRNRWASIPAWLGEEIEPMDAAEAETRLVELWLRSFGPGTEKDIKWWLGSTLGGVRKALASLNAVEVDLDGRIGYLMPDDLVVPEPVEPWGALLPALDPTTMGWFEREWYLGPHKDQLFDTNGNAGPTIWWDGRIVGGWAQTESGAVVLHFLEDVGSDGLDEIERQAAELERWLGGQRVMLRFPTPLSKTLAAGT